MTVELVDCRVPSRSRRWDGTGSGPDADDARAFEDGLYAVALSGVPPEARCELYIGDERQEAGAVRSGTTLRFEDGMYFESASGPTSLGIVRTDGPAPETVFSATLYVVPSKIGIANYRAMVDDLQRVCMALVTDATGKSDATAGRGEGARWLSPGDELQAAVAAFKRISPFVAEIKRAPKSSIVAKMRRIECGRARTPRAVAAMARRGIDPASPDAAARVCRAARLEETRDLPENRLVKAFLRLLESRISQCGESFEKEAERLGASRPYRDRAPVRGGKSLWETEDLPRLRILAGKAQTAASVRAKIAGELSGGFWDGVRESLFAPEPAQFAENAYYLAAANLILAYLRDLSHWGASFKSAMRAKKTSRIYEQWVLLQIVSAFSAAGLQVGGWEKALGGVGGEAVSLDIPRDSQFTAPFGEGYEIVVRYEPWIHNKDETYRAPEETLCHFARGDWSPDIVVELRRKPRSGAAETIYAVVVDAKYSRSPTREMRESVAKYALVRSTTGRFGKRVAKQVWLAYPGDGEFKRSGFWIDDRALSFKASRGVVYRGTDDAFEPWEQVSGSIVAVPSERADARGGARAASAQGTATGMEPRRVFADFASGTLAEFRRIVAADDGGRRIW